MTQHQYILRCRARRLLMNVRSGKVSLNNLDVERAFKVLGFNKAMKILGVKYIKDDVFHKRLPGSFGSNSR